MYPSLIATTLLICIVSSSCPAKAAAIQSSPSIPLSPPPSINPPAPLQQGKALYDAGRFADAVKVLQQAVQDYRSQGDSLRQAVTLSNLSLAYQQLGAWSEAKQAVEESLGLLRQEATGDQQQRLLAQTLDIQGRLQFGMGQTEAALATWQQAAELHVRGGDQTGEMRSRLNQAQAWQAMGFYRRSLDTLTELNQALQPQPDSLVKAVGLRSLGDALQVIGDLEQSRQVLQQSLAIARQLKSTAEESAALFSLGNTARAQQQPQQAQEFYKQAAQRSPSPILQTQARLNWLSLLVETGQRAEAETLLLHVWMQVEALPPSRPGIDARINLVQTVMRGWKPGSNSPLATQKLAQILAMAVQQAQSLGDRRAESFALGSLGGIYEQNRQWAEAQHLTEQALLLSQSVSAADISYRWQWQLGRLLKQQNSIPGAIAAYEAAVNTLQSLRSDLVAVNQDVQFTFRDSVEPVYRQTVELLLSQGESPSPQNLDKARRLIELLQLAELDNFFREACLNAQPVLLDQVVDRENPTAAIFYPIILENQLAVILKAPNQPLRYHAIPLPEKEVERVLARLQQVIKEPDAAKEVRSLSHQVYRWLIQPVEADLQQSRVNTLVFVLDGLLRNIPMAALYDGNQYLVEKYAVALSPGLQLFAPQPLAQTQLNALTAGLTQPPPAYSQFAPLPEVKAELDLIQQAGLSTTQLLDQTFTQTALEKQVNALPFKVVHLATHGQFSSQAKDTFILAADGPIDVSQLDRILRSRTQTPAEAIELLVLSACQTAAGDNRAALGLAGVAIRAGARSTLASLWQIDDRSTALFIGEFYRELSTAKVTKAEALRRAQLTLLKQYPNYSRPGYWAPYVLVGNWL
ncbi:CHAT domain-containing protein [Leptothermofonsia sp. ETS-13]|uniref:CHAT domain-containing protein n=1 Tax=Leptothermofonsia sp. ETS-13 TaxID=3035696 RepID=UPI003BA0F433